MKRCCFIITLLLLLPYQVKCQHDDPARFETLINLAEQTRETDPEQALEYAEEALLISEKRQDPKMTAQAQMKLASISFDLQNFTKAIEYGEYCESFFVKSGDVESISSLYNLLSTANFYIGNADMSDMYSDKSIELAEKYHISDVLFKQYYNRGAIAYYRGDYSYSMEFAFKALNVAKKNQQPNYMAHCYDLMGSLSKKMSEYAKSINYFDLSLKIYLETGDKISVGQTYINLATTYERIKQKDSARICFYKALDYYREAKSAEGLMITYTGLARFYHSEEKLDSAQFFIKKGLEAILLSESTKDLFELYNVAGNISFHQRDFQQAMEYYREALHLAFHSRNVEQESVVKQNISRNFAATQRYDSAFYYLSQSFAIIDSLYRDDEIQKRTYAFAEHNVQERFEKELEAERLQQRLWWVIMALCGLVIIILCVFLRMRSVRHKKMKSINAELNKYKADLEITLQDRTRKLKLSEQQILNLSNNLPNGAIFRFSFENEHNGKIIYVSSGWEELTGQPMNTPGSSAFFFNRIHPDDNDELLKALAYAIHNYSILDLVYRFCKNDNDMRWFHVRAIAIAGDDGLTYLDGYQVDETEQKHFEQELVAAKDKAEESDRLKSAFLANMSHEIRTPMNAIVGFSTLLINTPFSPHEQASYLELIQDNCYRLLQLIDDIIDVSKIEAGQLTLRMETVPLPEIMTVIRKHFESILTAKFPNVELRFDEALFDSSLIVHTDVFRLKQVFINLIENALKFTPEGSVKCVLSPDLTDAIHFVVIDTGVGIAYENQENIFQNFYKLDQHSGGTGLGLSIVQRVLLQMGGNIWVESEPGVGSSFHFTLPKINN